MTAVAFVTIARWASLVLAVAFVILVAECIRYWRMGRPEERRPYDWREESPELRAPKAAHVRRVEPKLRGKGGRLI